MRFITKKALERRTFIKGMGATIALPLLDAMIPAATASAKVRDLHVKRLAMCSCPWAWMKVADPAVKRRSISSPILSSLEPVKHNTTIFTNMELPGLSRIACHVQLSFLSAARAKVTEDRLLSGHNRGSSGGQSDWQETQLFFGVGDGR